MRFLRPGTLVQVDEALFDHSLGEPDTDQVEENGYLWIIQPEGRDMTGSFFPQVERDRYGRIVSVMYKCRSIATGEEYEWYRCEFRVNKASRASKLKKEQLS